MMILLVSQAPHISAAAVFDRHPIFRTPLTDLIALPYQY